MKPQLIVQAGARIARKRAQERDWYLRNADKKKARMKVYYRAHRDARLVASRRYRELNPRGWVNSHLKRLYGVTPEEVDRMRSAQHNCCAICSVSFDGTSKTLTPHIDHDHAAGKVRGLLCSPCNVSLGHLERDGFLRAALNYLGREP